MSAALLDDLLADYIAPVRIAHAAPTLAKAANVANREHPCRLAPDSEPCEELRIPAKTEQPRLDAKRDSQTFAAVRKSQTESQSEETCGPSQDSQNSQGCPSAYATVEPFDLTLAAWTDADITRFLDRRARLMRWGWAEPDAEKQAEKLVKRDREADDRVSCIDCRHYRPGRCGNHGRAGLNSPELGRDLASLLQRCPGFAVPVGGLR